MSLISTTQHHILNRSNPIIDSNDLGIHQTSIQKVDGKKLTQEQDVVAVEEPLEIRLGFEKNGQRTHKNISVTMRTPGDDFELTAGFLFAEGIIENANDVDQIIFCGPVVSGAKSRNVVRVELKSTIQFDLKKLDRHFYTTSSCGVCGKTSIDALKTQNKYCTEKIPKLGGHFDREMIHQLPRIMSQSQDVFDQTGGLHATALINVNGEAVILREDVGRHNAMDKVIGAALFRDFIPLSNHLIFLSGRASFELIQKALMAGIPIIAAVGAPSSLAVELAKEFDLTLIAFVRNNRFNIYNGAWRIK